MASGRMCCKALVLKEGQESRHTQREKLPNNQPRIRTQIPHPRQHMLANTSTHTHTHTHQCANTNTRTHTRACQHNTNRCLTLAQKRAYILMHARTHASMHASRQTRRQNQIHTSRQTSKQTLQGKAACPRCARHPWTQVNATTCMRVSLETQQIRAPTRRSQAPRDPCNEHSHNSGCSGCLRRATTPARQASVGDRARGLRHACACVCIVPPFCLDILKVFMLRGGRPPNELQLHRLARRPCPPASARA